MCDSIRISVLRVLGGIYCIVFTKRVNYSAFMRNHLTELNPSLFLSASSHPCFMVVDWISTLTSSMGFLWSFFHSCCLRLMRNVVFLSAFHIKDTINCEVSAWRVSHRFRPKHFCPPITLFVTGLVVLSASLVENHHKTSKTRSTCLPELIPHMKHWNTDEVMGFKRHGKTNEAACSESVSLWLHSVSFFKELKNHETVNTVHLIFVYLC